MTEPVTLTDDMRHWLDRYDGIGQDRTLLECVQQFQVRFGLDKLQCGRMVMLWILERI